MLGSFLPQSGLPQDHRASAPSLNCGKCVGAKSVGKMFFLQCNRISLVGLPASGKVSFIESSKFWRQGCSVLCLQMVAGSPFLPSTFSQGQCQDQTLEPASAVLDVQPENRPVLRGSLTRLTLACSRSQSLSLELSSTPTGDNSGSATPPSGCSVEVPVGT